MFPGHCLSFISKLPSNMWLTTGSSSVFVSGLTFLKSHQYKNKVKLISKWEKCSFMSMSSYDLLLGISPLSFQGLASSSGTDVKTNYLNEKYRYVDISYQTLFKVVRQCVGSHCAKQKIRYLVSISRSMASPSYITYLSNVSHPKATFYLLML